MAGVAPRRKTGRLDSTSVMPEQPTTTSPNRTLMLVLAYLWLPWIPLLIEKNDREVQWHAKHGLVLMLIELSIWIILFVALGPLGIFGCVLWLFSPLMWLAQLLVNGACLIKALNGERLIIPRVSEFADRF